MNASHRFRKSKTVVERKIRGEHILVPVAGTMEQLDSIYTLNPTGSLVWENAVAGKTKDDICVTLMAEFDVDAQTAHRDVLRTLEELSGIGALERIEE